MIDESIRSIIRVRLARIEQDYGVRILLAVESGSRAWGFPSPDSDYDVRFVYIGTTDRYLKLFDTRDVIEEPLCINGIDLGGWDLRKALQLMVGGNGVILEWLKSPIWYRKNIDFTDALYEQAAKHLDRRALIGHYYGQAIKVMATNSFDCDKVIGKRYFYILRPALALRWLRTREGIPPMSMYGLMETVSDDMRATINQLIHWKSGASEKELHDRIPAIEDFVEAETTAALIAKKAERKSKKEMDSVDAMFHLWVTAVTNGADVSPWP